MSYFAENLKKLRAEKGLSQEDMARNIGVHANHLSRYERGVSVPSIEVVEKIADLLNVSIDELVINENNKKIDSKVQDKELVSLFEKVQALNEKQKQTVKDLMHAFIFKSSMQQQLTI